MTTDLPNAAAVAARLERLPVSSWHRKLVVIVGIGLFFEFFEVFAGSVLLAVLRPAWELGPLESALLVGSVFFGMFTGALTLGRLADRFGRKRMFIINLMIYLGFGLLAAAAPNVWWLIACRFLAGLGAGAEAALIPTYLSEFIPRQRRGRYIGLAMTIGFLSFPVVSLLGAPLAQVFWLIDGWRWLLIIGSSGVVLVVWMRRNLPESPRWLVATGQTAKAEAELARIEATIMRRTGTPLPPVPEVASIEPATRAAEIPRPEFVRRVLAIGALLVFGTMGYYGFGSLAPVLLVDKGFDVTQSLIYTAIIAIGYPLGAALASFVAESLERRALVITAAAGTGLFGLVFGFAASDWLILLAGFLVGVAANVLGSSSTMYMAEVFPTRIRSTMVGVCYSLGRLSAGVMPFVGLPILAAFGAAGVLIASAVLLSFACLFVLVFGPRTTGLSLEQLTEPGVAAQVILAPENSNTAGTLPEVR
ncbi:MFS transporter [Pseudonocardia sp. NPDC049635]|uniref:MFS transporter n=1 Tax=Pseudonocardia sp. NPDC049635 TaxID=3155506 RepID=UPI0033EAC4ED